MAIDDKELLTGEAALAKLRELLAHFPIALMITVHDREVLARPIGVVGEHAAFDGTLWFITDNRSRKVKAIEAGALTSLLFQNDDRGAYLHLYGTAAIVEDRDKLAQLYTSVQRTWFPDGLDDPNMVLVRFDAECGDYWDSHNGLMRLVGAFAKAVVTGTPGRSGNAGSAQL
jgi:general stress protein 26